MVLCPILKWPKGTKEYVSIRCLRVHFGRNIVAQIGETFNCVAAVRTGRGFYCCIAITIVKRMSIALFIATELGVGGRGDTSSRNNAESGWPCGDATDMTPTMKITLQNLKSLECHYLDWFLGYYAVLPFLLLKPGLQPAMQSNGMFNFLLY